jgi:hypothetical protein
MIGRAYGRFTLRTVLLVATLAGMAAELSAAPAGARPVERVAATETTLSLGPLEAVPGMQSGLPAGAFGIAVLGKLGNDLYLFGSQSETTGALAGVWRYRSGSWSKLGETRLEFGNGAGADYNRLAPYGAVEFNGRLYVGDRRAGNLYELLLTPAGEFVDVVVAATVGHEDVFPGPIWLGRLILGTFGAYSTGENPGIYAYDGSTVQQLLELTSLGNAGYVTSIVQFGNDLWVSGINASATLSQVWKINSKLRATLQYSGPNDYRLVTSNSRLFAVGTRFAYPYETHQFNRWNGNSFIPISTEVGPFLMIGSIGAVDIDGTLLDLTYYNGIFGLSGQTLRQVVPGMPAMGAAMSVTVHQGYLWIASNQPVGLYRVRIGGA